MSASGNTGKTGKPAKRKADEDSVPLEEERDTRKPRRRYYQGFDNVESVFCPLTEEDIRAALQEEHPGQDVEGDVKDAMERLERFISKLGDTPHLALLECLLKFFGNGSRSEAMPQQGLFDFYPDEGLKYPEIDHDGKRVQIEYIKAIWATMLGSAQKNSYLSEKFGRPVFGHCLLVAVIRPPGSGYYVEVPVTQELLDECFEVAKKYIAIRHREGKWV